jgi:hypothetical protein
MELSKTLRGVKEKVAGDKRYLSALTVAAGALSLPFFSPAQRYVALPLLVIANIAVYFMASLWGREDGEPVPLFEIGTVYCAALAVYSLVPFLNYLSAGMTWSNLSDRRLLAYSSPPEEVGRFAWRYVVYFLSFAATYLWARDKAGSQKRAAVISDSPPLLLVALPVAVLMICFYVLSVVRVMDVNPSYSQMTANRLDADQLPLIVTQVSGHLRGILLIFKMALLILLFERWAAKRWRAVICLWLTLETAYTILNMGARFETMLLLMCALLCYHRLVKPIRLSQAVLTGLLLITGFQLVGMAREYFNKGDQPMPRLTLRSLASANSEFQSIFATAYDLDRMSQTGQLPDIPAQVYFNDFLMPVPRQLLSIKKIDPSQWYLDIKGFNGQTGFMFGVIAQAIVGFGLLELVLRGALVGLLFAWAQRWYTRRAARFLPTLVYVWLCVWSYYTFRASTFYLLSPIIYRLLPVVVLIYAGARLLGRLPRFAAHGRPAL